MINMLASSAVDGRVKPKTMKFACSASPLSMQYQGVRAKTGWLKIMIMCPSGVTCLPADCYFSELAKNLIVLV